MERSVGEVPSAQTSPPAVGEPPPVLLFFNDFPPSNANGGTVLIRRILSGYPRARLIGLTSAKDAQVLAQMSRRKERSGLEMASDWCCHHETFFSMIEQGRWGVGRLKALLNWLLLPVTALYAVWLIRKQGVSAILSVANGTYFVAAAAASRWSKTPLIMIVHDDWIPAITQATSLPPPIFHFLMRRALRSASHIFAVSAGMQEMLQTQYGVASEVQMPATAPWPAEPFAPEEPAGVFRILYMGNGASAQDSLDLLVNLIRDNTLAGYGLENVELRLCTPVRIEHPAIKNLGWVSESEARRQVAAADVLFLPYGFTSEDRPVALTSFPAKSADYFASGQPILVIGPRDSTIVRYAQKYDCAEVVTELSKDALAQAIYRLATDADRRRQLALNARKSFEANQNIYRQQERLIEVVQKLARKAK
jgi:glycosyltransferase involved in cell wall biosynthesis